MRPTAPGYLDVASGANRGAADEGGIMIKVIISFKRRPGMSTQEFRDYRRDVHVPTLLAIPEATKLRRLVVSYPLLAPEAPEPTFDAVVEAWFDSREEMDGLFASESFRTRVDPDHANFIDPSSVVWLVTEELVDVGEA
ncbi:MAG: ethyl tert-butyl ether degradation protein EthD [Labilithrix sp.]|nr:ethyl tert-butyl ether degradation protein EthD [Labilithrix sp.]